MDEIGCRESVIQLFNQLKPLAAVIFLQVGIAGMDIYSKVALDEGMSCYVFVVYRHAIATLVMAPFAVFLDRTKRTKLKTSLIFKFALLGLLEPVIGQVMYYLGLKYTTATFGSAMSNVLPAIAFVMACIFGLEMVKFSSIHTQAKVIGTIATVAGAMIMTFVKGPIFELFKKSETINYGAINGESNDTDVHNMIKGSLFIICSMFSWACFMILQAQTLKTYPSELLLTAWICLFGTAEGAILAMVMERRNSDVWAIRFDNKFLVAVYGGIICSGLAYYIQGVVMKARGPVYVTAFSPLSMVIVAIMGSFIMGEKLFLGSFIGAIVIVIGLFVVVWGKNKDCESSSPSIDHHITQKISDSGDTTKRF